MTGHDPETRRAHPTIRHLIGKARGDIALAGVWVVFGIAILLETRRIKLISVEDPLGPRLVPEIIGALLVALGLAIAADAYRRQRQLSIGEGASLDDETLAEEVTEVHPASTTRGLVTTALSIVYVVALPIIGYIPATALGSLSIALYLRDTENVVILVLVSISVTAATYWIFTDILNVQLPTALWS